MSRESLLHTLAALYKEHDISSSISKDLSQGCQGCQVDRWNNVAALPGVAQ